MPNTITRKGWRAPSTEFSGPGELADAILEIKKVLPPAAVSDLSEEGVRQLVTFCYFASLRAEEGRFPHFRIFAPNHHEVNRLRLSVKFASPVLLDDVDRVRHLAPVASIDCAICVAERDGKLYCVGLVNLTRSELELLPGRPEVWFSRSTPMGLLVRVDGPGELRASDGSYTLILRAGALRCVAHFTSIESIAVWLKELSESVYHDFLESSKRDLSGRFGGKWSPLSQLDGLLSDIVGRAVESRHGGAFVVVPDKSAYQRLIKCKFNTEDTSISAELTEWWTICANYVDCKDPGRIENHVRRWNAKRFELAHCAQAIADLANVDGCVLLDRKLSVLGFGGKINVSDDDIKATGLRYANHVTREDRDEAEIREFGTRHLSAFRLCKALPGAMVFVVSQDAELRLFFSDDDHVYFYDQLCPSSSNTPQW